MNSDYVNSVILEVINFLFCSCIINLEVAQTVSFYKCSYKRVGLLQHPEIFILLISLRMPSMIVVEAR